MWDVFQRWLAHPGFIAKDGNLSLRSCVLNELTFLLGEEQLRPGAWHLLAGLAAKYPEGHPTGLDVSLTISTFELATEPPEVGCMLELLFSLAPDPHTRWAVFAAYQNHPSRLRPHAKKYSGGLITDQDCDHWLISQGSGQDEILAPLESHP